MGSWIVWLGGRQISLLDGLSGLKKMNCSLFEGLQDLCGISNASLVLLIMES